MSTPSSPAPVAPSDTTGEAAVPTPEAVSPRPASPELLMIRRVAVGSLLGLIVLGLAWELWLAPLRPGGTWGAIKVLPLCLPLAGILKNRMYTYRWLSLLVWLYVAEAALRATSEGGLSQWLAAVELVLALALFVACSVHVRARLARARATPPA